MGGHVLGRTDLAQQLHGVAADALGGDFHELDHAFGVDQEGAAVSQALAGAHHAEVVGDHARGVADHGVLDLADGRRGVVPGLVREVGVGRDRIDLHAELLELGVVVGQVLQLRRADEGEVGRVEEHHRPLALQVGVADLDELAALIGLGGEGKNGRVDGSHARSLRALGGWIGGGNTAFLPPHAASQRSILSGPAIEGVDGHHADGNVPARSLI